MYTPLKFATNTLNQSRSIGWPKNPTLEPSIIGGLHDLAFIKLAASSMVIRRAGGSNYRFKY